MSGINFPLQAIREQVASALDMIVHLTRLVDGTRRVSKITEVVGMESEVITLQDVFVAKPVDERAVASESTTFLRPLECTGLQPQFRHKLVANGVLLPEDFYQPEHALQAVNGNGKGWR